METQLAFIMTLGDSTEGLHDQLGHILGLTAVLVFCGFISGSLIINIISWIWHLKHCIS